MIKRQETMENPPKAKGTDKFDYDDIKFEHSEICKDIHYLKKITAIGN
jgi:hypothetical protein